jgi:hypothetical protein
MDASKQDNLKLNIPGDDWGVARRPEQTFTVIVSVKKLAHEFG